MKGRPLLRDAGSLLVASFYAQFVNVAAGLLIVRALEIHQYAVYTLGSTLFSVGTVLATMSVPSAVIHILSQTESNITAVTVREAVRLLGKLSAFAFTVLCGMVWLYRDALGSSSLAVLFLSVCTAYLASRGNLWRALAFVSRQANAVVRAEYISASLRLILVSIVLNVSLNDSSAITLLAANAASIIIAERLLRAPLSCAERCENTRLAIHRYIVPLVPEHLYFLIQGQISFLILAYCGMQSAVAELGALSRLSLLISAFSVLNTGVFQPFVARHRSCRDYLLRACGVLAFWSILAGCVLTFSIVAPNVLVTVLGARYWHLAEMVPLAILGSTISMLGATVYIIVLAGGMPGGLSLAIPVGIIVQVSYVSLFGISRVSDALKMMLLLATAELLVRIGVFVRVVYAMHARERSRQSL